MFDESNTERLSALRRGDVAPINESELSEWGLECAGCFARLVLTFDELECARELYQVFTVEGDDSESLADQAFAVNRWTLREWVAASAAARTLSSEQRALANKLRRIAMGLQWWPVTPELRGACPDACGHVPAPRPTGPMTPKMAAAVETLRQTKSRGAPKQLEQAERSEAYARHLGNKLEARRGMPRLPFISDTLRTELENTLAAAREKLTRCEADLSKAEAKPDRHASKAPLVRKRRAYADVARLEVALAELALAPPPMRSTTAVQT